MIVEKCNSLENVDEYEEESVFVLIVLILFLFFFLNKEKNI